MLCVYYSILLLCVCYVLLLLISKMCKSPLRTPIISCNIYRRVAIYRTEVNLERSPWPTTETYRAQPSGRAIVT